jgi:hypothetical protein
MGSSYTHNKTDNAANETKAYDTVCFESHELLSAINARVAQWFESWAQISDDLCIDLMIFASIRSLRRRFESHCGTWVPVIRMRLYKPRPCVAVGVSR